MGQFDRKDLQRIGRAVRFTEKVPSLRGHEEVRRGQNKTAENAGQFAGSANMVVTQNQMGISYPFAHELL